MPEKSNLIRACFNNTRYVVFEGLDGCGKNLQLELLQKAIEEKGSKCIQVAEPCEDNPVGALLREFLKNGTHVKAHAVLFLANRTLLMYDKIIPALAEGTFVLSSRSFISTIVYQQEHWDKKWLEDIHQKMPINPGFTFIFDISPYQALARIRERAGTAECYETYETLAKVRERYLEYAREHPEVIVIDAAGTPDEVHSEVIRALTNKNFFRNFFPKFRFTFGEINEESDQASTENSTETGSESEATEGCEQESATSVSSNG